MATALMTLTTEVPRTREALRAALRTAGRMLPELTRQLYATTGLEPVAHRYLAPPLPGPDGVWRMGGCVVGALYCLAAAPSIEDSSSLTPDHGWHQEVARAYGWDRDYVVGLDVGFTRGRAAWATIERRAAVRGKAGRGDCYWRGYLDGADAYEALPSRGEAA